MAEHRSLFKAVAAALGAAAMLVCGVVGVGTANAGPAPVSVGSDGKITVTNAEPSHQYKAVQIGKYSNVEADGNSISQLAVKEVTSPSTLVNAINNAGQESRATTPTTGECANDVVCWISKHWLGYENGRTDNADTQSKDAPYTGPLRDFVTSLQGKNDFKVAMRAASPVSVSGTTAEFAGLDEGLYVVEDTAPNSIPMLVGSTVGPDYNDTFITSILPKFGQINAKKSNNPTVEKKWVSTKDAGNQSVDR